MRNRPGGGVGGYGRGGRFACGSKAPRDVVDPNDTRSRAAIGIRSAVANSSRALMSFRRIETGGMVFLMGGTGF